MKKKKHLENHPPHSRAKHILFSSFWFVIGFIFAASFLGSFVFLYFQYIYRDKVIPGVFIGSIYVGDKTKEEIEGIFSEKNTSVENVLFQIEHEGKFATTSAKNLNIGYDTNLISNQSLNLGKSANIFSNIYIALNSYLNGVYLKTSYTFDEEALKKVIEQYEKQIYQEPEDAQFTVQNNRVVAFKESKDGKSVDLEKLENSLEENVPQVVQGASTDRIVLTLPVKTLHPNVPTEKANSFGIVEEIGSGKSYFAGSIPNRIHNVTLAASRINGVLVAPNEEFSFTKNLGDVSKYTGYKEAYVIQNGRTVLGDGGGVCQVSTTLFRAILNAGLPITERHAHSYRVGYYEQASPPGLDATVFSPSVDLRFKNDTNNHILIQSSIDPNTLMLTFVLYGKADGRVSQVTKPVILSQTPPPDATYQDDPTLPKGTEKQVEHAAWGAQVSFRRSVTKNGKVVISETFNTRYVPWKAVYLKGTKEG